MLRLGWKGFERRAWDAVETVRRDTEDNCIIERIASVLPAMMEKRPDERWCEGKEAEPIIKICDKGATSGKAVLGESVCRRFPDALQVPGTYFPNTILYDSIGILYLSSISLIIRSIFFIRYFNCYDRIGINLTFYILAIDSDHYHR